MRPDTHRIWQFTCCFWSFRSNKADGGDLCRCGVPVLLSCSLTRSTDRCCCGRNAPAHHRCFSSPSPRRSRLGRWWCSREVFPGAGSPRCRTATQRDAAPPAAGSFLSPPAPSACGRKPGQHVVRRAGTACTAIFGSAVHGSCLAVVVSSLGRRRGPKTASVPPCGNPQPTGA